MALVVLPEDGVRGGVDNDSFDGGGADVEADEELDGAVVAVDGLARWARLWKLFFQRSNLD
jgi:hypothetical protein